MLRAVCIRSLLVQLIVGLAAAFLSWAAFLGNRQPNDVARSCRVHFRMPLKFGSVRLASTAFPLVPHYGGTMVSGDIFGILDNAHYGAYAVDEGQVIRYWNAGAEGILGYSAADVLGRRCYEVLQRIPVQGSSLFCVEDCPIMRTGLQGGVPQVMTRLLRCATGQTKRVHFTPLFLPKLQDDPKLLVYLFHEEAEGGQASEPIAGGNALARILAGAAWTDAPREDREPLTAREREVLGLLSGGLNTNEIACNLHLSVHTVRNHVSNARHKLQARTKLEAVLVAQNLALL